MVLADSDAGVRRVLTMELSQAGFTVVACSDAFSVLRHFAIGERADVLVTDVDMSHGVEGFSLDAEARRQRPSLPIVLLSARLRCADRTASGSHVVRPPPMIEHIKWTIRDCLGIGAEATAPEPTKKLRFDLRIP